MNVMNQNTICHSCRYLFITHDKFRRWGCSNFGFKSPNLPSYVVFATTGMKCAYFKKKDLLIQTNKNVKRGWRLA